jgi:hypothetical protein
VCISPDKSLLGGIFCFGRVAQHPITKIEDRALVGFDQLGKSLVIPLAGTSYPEFSSSFIAIVSQGGVIGWIVASCNTQFPGQSCGRVRVDFPGVSGRSTARRQSAQGQQCAQNGQDEANNGGRRPSRGGSGLA